MVTLRVAFLSSMVLELLASLSVALVAVAIGLRLVYGGSDARDRFGGADSRAGGVSAAAAARYPVPRRGRWGRGHREGAGHPGHSAAGARHAHRRACGSRVAVGRGGRRRTPGERGHGRPAVAGHPCRPDHGDHRGQRRREDHAVAAAGRDASDRTPAGCSSAGGGRGEVDLADWSIRAVWRQRVAWAGQGAAHAGGVDQGQPGARAIRGSTTRPCALRWNRSTRPAFVDELPHGWHTVLGEAGAGNQPGAAATVGTGQGAGPAGRPAAARRADRGAGRGDRAAGAGRYRGRGRAAAPWCSSPTARHHWRSPTPSSS